MRIGILTVPFNNNYGGFLQAYALRKVLTDMGHEVVIINRRRNLPQPKPGLKGYAQAVKSKYRRLRTYFLSRNTKPFVDKYLSPLTRPYYSTADLEREVGGFDAYVVGSDQVWRYAFARGSICDFFLSFVKEDKFRFSYAASFGVDYNEYPDDVAAKCTALLQRFDRISVREKSGMDLLTDTFKVARDKIRLDVDPTLLLDAGVYANLFRECSRRDGRYIFSYILDGNKADRAFVARVGSEAKLGVVYMNAQKLRGYGLKPIPGVEQWLSALSHASFVVTDSFHGCVFSILFNKPFWVLVNEKRGYTRITSLLELFGLKSRIITRQVPAQNLTDETEIDWSGVNKVLQGLREDSLSYIREELLKSS